MSDKNKCLINGAAMRITGGKLLKDGTAFSTKHGRTLLDGTGYEISLDIRPKWVIKASPAYGGKEIDETIPFVSNGVNYKRIHIYYMDSLKIKYSINGAWETTVYSYKKWESDEFRTLIFDEEPTGALLNWLKKNASLQ